MKTKRSSGLLAVVTSFAIAFLVMPTAAHAYVSKQGSQLCGQAAPNSWAQGSGSGVLEIKAPGRAGYALRNVGSSGTASVSGVTGGGFWRVQTLGSLNSPGTYAWCTSAS